MRTFLLAVLLIPALALAQDAATPPPAKKPVQKDPVYKWTDDKGVIHYTDKPPTKDATPAALPPLQTYRRGTNPDLNKFAPPSQQGRPLPGGAPIQVEVVTPARDETFRGGERTVPVAVVVTPQISGEQRLQYFLDGKPAGAATTDTSFALTDVDRGEHTVTVAVMDEGGQEISRSLPVTFFMQPPTVRRK